MAEQMIDMAVLLEIAVSDGFVLLIGCDENSTPVGGPLIVFARLRSLRSPRAHLLLAVAVTCRAKNGVSEDGTEICAISLLVPTDSHNLCKSSFVLCPLEKLAISEG